MTDTDRYWQTAHQVCTPAELAVLELRDHHNRSTRAISMTLGISRWTVRDRLDNADRKIAQALADKETAA